MKTKKKNWITYAVLAVSVALIAALGALYVSGVRSSLWNKSVTDLLEITAQGRHALDTYIEKDGEEVHALANMLRAESSDARDAIRDKIVHAGGVEARYVCVDLQTAAVYTNIYDGDYTLEPALTESFRAMAGRGVRTPYIDAYTGLRMLGAYERFRFADGVEGYVQKTQLLSAVSERFSLSFYDDTGFSYLVDRDGAVMMRSTHPNSNRTFQNLFDIIDLGGNDARDVESFRQALANMKKGVARFRYDAKPYVFCYVPMISVDGWYLVSIIPDAVINKQGNTIVLRTVLLCALILTTLLIVALIQYLQTRRQHREIERFAFYDTLTGLYRYDKFLLDGEVRFRGSGKRCAVLYVDIVNFKMLNDLEGYDFGDRVLRLTTDVLRREAAADDLLCRIAGDDFLLMTADDDRARLAELCRRIAAGIKAQETGGRAYQVRIGVCRGEDTDAANVNGLVDRARMASQKAKDDSETLNYYDETMHAALRRAAELESRMQAALENGEFVTFIQPKYSADGRRILGGEALVRWRQADGMISPGEFIPLFERNGFIRKVDEAVFVSVCRMLRARLDAGLPSVTISVNVSRISLFGKGFTERYVALKREYGIPDGLIELEITESVLLENTSAAFSVLESLRKQGFACSIDDFGSGYSSLNALKDLPADVIKLDRKFLEENVASEKTKIIIRSVIEMAKNLALVTVAEGVENESQLHFLSAVGCDMIQGFVFSKPLPSEGFYELLDRQRP